MKRGFQGLSNSDVKKKLSRYGKNEIKKTKKISAFKLFFSQFTNPVIILLIIAAVISFLVNFLKQENFFDSILILGIVFVAGIAGFVQDYKAEKTIEALKKIATPNARVIRNGKEREIKANEVVPSDLIVLESGDIVPADAEIIKGYLEVDESILTGESKAVKKKQGMKIFSGSSVYIGEAIAKVYATGMKTKIGEIAEKMQEIERGETPFQGHMKKFTRKIVGLTVLIIVLTFIICFKKFGFIEASLIAISLAVAAIPEDLPAVITIALSLGAKRMAKLKALIRRLAITESVGSVDVICTDKTGTLTEGKMKLRKLWFLEENKKIKNLAEECCYYCNNAKKIIKKKKKEWVGDETDIALKQYSLRFIKHKKTKRIEEISFTSERKMMTVVQKFKNKKIIFSKGAPEVILKKSNRIFLDKPINLDEKLKKKILEKNKEFASLGYRILALAYKQYSKPIEKNLIFLCLAILSDPPRREARKAVSDCHSAGIRVIMITGDNPLTAKAIAEEVGIKTEKIIIGKKIDEMNDKELESCLKKTNIFARTNPIHKLRILKILQKKHVVAMTGDGVNDSLALKKADVGISMGIKGTEVAREASDIVLLNDNFATIRNAIKEGRRIFDNIRKFVNYLLTCNVAEVLVVLIASLIFPFIFLFPIQILWINLITDGLPALALSIDPASPDIMKRNPRSKKEGIINKKLGFLIGTIGIEKSLIILGTFLIIFLLTKNLNLARTTLFTSFIMYEFVRIGVIRYNEKLKIKDWFKNKLLIFALILSLLLQLALIYTPLAFYFKIVPLGILEWIIIIIGAIVGFILGILITKIINRKIK